MSSPSHLTPAQTEALQARFALRVTARLEDGAHALPHDITERLRIARQQAVAAATQARLGTLAAPATAGAVVLASPELALAGAGSAGQAGGFSTPNFGQRHSDRHQADPQRRLDDGPTPWIWRLASALPAVALVAGLWGVGDWTRHEQVQAAADVDMSLLTDDLPPSAYADPGFEEYLKTDADTPVAAASTTESTAEQEAEQAAAEDLAPAVSSDAHTDVMPGVDSGVAAPSPEPR